MSSSINRRRMDAEAEANRDIEAKDYQHTAAYFKLTGGEAFREQQRMSAMSGKALNRHLMRRVRDHIQSQSNVNDYQQSHLGANNFRHSELAHRDEKDHKHRHRINRGGEADTVGKKRDFVKERRDRLLDRRDSQAMERAVPFTTSTTPGNREQSAHASEKGRIGNRSNRSSSPLSRRTDRGTRAPMKHHFKNPKSRGYDPYA